MELGSVFPVTFNTCPAAEVVHCLQWFWAALACSCFGGSTKLWLAIIANCRITEGLAHSFCHATGCTKGLCSECTSECLFPVGDHGSRKLVFFKTFGGCYSLVSGIVQVMM